MFSPYRRGSGYGVPLPSIAPTPLHQAKALWSVVHQAPGPVLIIAELVPLSPYYFSQLSVTAIVHTARSEVL